MFHAIVNEDDIQFLFSIPNLDIFWCCRCHLVAKDGSTAHEHLHALVQYQKGTHLALKKRMQRAKQRFHPKTTFKPIFCPDHAVGVLRYICCEDGQRLWCTWEHKNGWITADKYNSEQFRCHTPNIVVVFSNEESDIKEAVKDRWRILQIKEDDLIDISKRYTNKM